MLSSIDSIREVLPGLAPRTQKDYLRAIEAPRPWCGKEHPDRLGRRDVLPFLATGGKGKV